MVSNVRKNSTTTLAGSGLPRTENGDYSASLDGVLENTILMASEFKHGLMVVTEDSAQSLCERRSSLDSELVSWLLPNVAPESVAGREHRREEKIKLPSFGEESRKVKIYYAFADGSFFPQIWTPFEVLSVKPFVVSPLFSVTPTIPSLLDKADWESTDNYQRNGRHISAEWQRRDQIRRKLVDASVELQFSEEPERYRYESLLRAAHDSAIAWTQTGQRVPAVSDVQRFLARAKAALASIEKESHPVLYKWRRDVCAFLRSEERQYRITRAVHPSVTQTREFWREPKESERLRHFDLLDEPRRAGFFHGLPLVEWITNTVETELQSLRTAERQAFICCVAFLNPPVGKIEFQPRTEYVGCPARSEQTTKDTIRKWNRKLLEFKDDDGKSLFPQEPRTHGGFRLKGFRSKVYAEAAGGNEMSEENRLSRIESYEDDDEPINPDHARCETDWIENRESQNDSPTDPAELREEVQKIFNRERAKRSDEKIADIKSHPLYEGEKWKFYTEMTNTPITADETGKANTIIQRSIRHEQRRDEYLSVANSDPEFRLARKNFLHDNKSSAAGWYVALRLNNRWMLYRLKLAFDETFPLGAAFPDVEKRALMQLWLEKKAQAERDAKGKRAKKAAAQRVDAAFDRVKAIHFLPARQWDNSVLTGKAR
jgi:hypothetical protein